MTSGSEIEEVRRRVEAALESFNRQEVNLPGDVEVEFKLDRYDYKPTHWNLAAKERLEQVTLMFAMGEADEIAVREAIREFRDRSEVGNVDFIIRVLEPAQEDFKRLCLLLEHSGDRRVTIPVTDPAESETALQRKVMTLVEMVMADRTFITTKLRQQFNGLLATTREKDPWLLGLMLKVEKYNPYQKRLVPEPSVLLDYKDAPAPAEENDERPAAVDNSAFEAERPAPTRPAGSKRQTKPVGGRNGDSPVSKALTAPAEPPTTLHEEFAAFCEELYGRQTANN